MLRLVIRIFLIIFFTTFALQAREINIDKLIETATSSKKHLLVFIHQTDCGYCVSMIDFTLNNEIVKAYIKKNFIYEHVNIRENDVVTYKKFKGNGREFSKHVGYAFYPSVLFFGKNKEIIFGEAGYIDTNLMPNEKRFYTILHYIHSRAYKEKEFDDYTFDIKEEL